MDRAPSWPLHLAAAIAIAACALATAAQAQTGAFPNRTIRIVVPATAGGNNDLVARAMAQKMSEGLGQSVIVENRPGASSLLGSQYVGRSAPDGYTILHASNTLAVAPSLVKDAGYDPIKDFVGVSLTGIAPQVLLVNPKLPVKSVAELIALAKARKEPMTYGSAGVGGTSHIAAEMFARRAGIKLLHVPYKGNSQAMADLIGGQIDIMFDLGSAALPQVKSGVVRGLAVTSAKRLSGAPELRTLDESGLPGYEDIVFTGLFAPAGTPPEVLRRLHAEVEKAVRAPDLRRKFQDVGIELTASPSPEQLTRYLKEEFERKAAVIKAANIEVK